MIMSNTPEAYLPPEFLWRTKNTHSLADLLREHQPALDDVVPMHMPALAAPRVSSFRPDPYRRKNSRTPFVLEKAVLKTQKKVRAAAAEAAVLFTTPVHV